MLDWIFPIVLIIGGTLGVAHEIKFISLIINDHNTPDSSKLRLLICTFLSIVGLVGFLAAFSLQILSGRAFIHLTFISLDSLNLLCWLFLMLFFVSEYVILPKARNIR